jgi:hypothetical protein
MDMDENYEKGYQEGVMDTEEALIEDFRTSTGISITNETRLGYTVATVTLQTTSDSRLYELLMRMTKAKYLKTTESVVSPEDELRNPLSRALKSTNNAHISYPTVKRTTSGLPAHKGNDLHFAALDELSRIDPLGLLE